MWYGVYVYVLEIYAYGYVWLECLCPFLNTCRPIYPDMPSLSLSNKRWTGRFLKESLETVVFGRLASFLMV